MMDVKEEIIQKQKIISIQNDLTIIKLKMNNLEKLIKEIHKKINGI